MLNKLFGEILGRKNTVAVEPVSSARPVYFLSVNRYLFNTFLPRIWGMLGSRAAGAVSDEFAGQEVKSGGWVLPILSMAQFQALAEREPVDVVHFCENLEQYRDLPAMPGARVKDFLQILLELGLPHTYATMHKEQSWWKEHGADYDSLLAQFGDERSRATLAARRHAIMATDRQELLKAAFSPAVEYFNNASAHASIIPGTRATYVDVGAAHGDTVDKFLRVTGGQFEKIYAFEPSPGQFAELQKRGVADARISTFQAAVGESAGEITFFDNMDNPFSGNALSGEGRATQVNCVRLDDLVPECSLIKMDVEGYECNVLRGARRLISQCHPDMAVTCYHYPQDLSEIVELVRQIHPYRHMALRHYSACLHDSVLLFSDRQAFNA